MKILIVRHGESHSNTSGRMMSKADWDLTDKGALQCLAARERINALVGSGTIRDVFSSTLKRARQTAELVSGGFPGIIYTPLLCEMDLGDLEGLTWEERVVKYPRLDYDNMLDKADFPGGESYNDAESRCKRFIDGYINSLDNGACVLVVSHGITIRILINILAGRPREHVNYINWPDNTAITELEYDKASPPATIIRLSDYTHLTEKGLNSPAYDKWGLFSKTDYLKLKS